ncbi:hypothetical protein HX819_01110 [Pseudomonas sp. D6002]|uniref:hypothetical protein n=1 Tax=unclassified Pseudomonas TaxID=196821 RepID=UPI0015A01D07|nr:MULTISPECIES: hypothetical protein [unclassified Pseudomonas]NVZ94160.1 hypothetical protein [Pseudomonas sp. B6001]NWB12989.1 hypothetical protein [Pseudomonas sp. D6002]
MSDSVRIVGVSQNLSYSAFEIFPSVNEVRLASGTAFAYKHNGRSYFITNWHNVTGRNPLTYACLSAHAAIPDNIQFRYPELKFSGENKLLGWQGRKLKLYDDADKPIWLEHPQHGSLVDVVAIEVYGIDETAMLFTNENEDVSKYQNIGAGTEAMILGFPHGISGGSKFPVWKRGSIASEPDFDLDNLPKFILDTATRKGMSGSPVFAKLTGFNLPVGALDMGEGILGTCYEFLGCYSGSIGREPFDAQLGIVWKERAIIEIIEGSKRGVSSHVLSVREHPKKGDQHFFDWDDWGFAD